MQLAVEYLVWFHVRSCKITLFLWVINRTILCYMQGKFCCTRTVSSAEVVGCNSIHEHLWWPSKLYDATRILQLGYTQYWKCVNTYRAYDKTLSISPQHYDTECYIYSGLCLSVTYNAFFRISKWDTWILGVVSKQLRLLRGRVRARL